MTRKERELQEREEKILMVSRNMIVKDGYHGLSMDKVASQLEYSKGTIYNHFDCKEEIVIALAIETAEQRAKLFERASAFRGNTRDRLLAIGIAAEIFVKLYPNHFQFEQIVRLSSVIEKTSQKRQNVMRSCESRCVGIVSGIVRDAISRGDVILTEETTPEELVFGLWSMCVGAFSIITSSDPLMDIGIRDPFATLLNNYSKFLDGFGWKPLSIEMDYGDIVSRIEDEVFGHEIKQLQEA